MYEKPSICRKCGGKCCKRYPGSCWPVDFDSDYQKIRAAIESGMYCIDWWEGSISIPGAENLDRVYFLRPAVKGMEGVIYDPLWHGECIFLEETCILTPEARPRGCRKLEPKEDGCISHVKPKYDAAIAWLSYQDLLESF